ncbi:ubiquinone/menaquinone biosynthesis C-methylase UbiE [Actinoplanes tereljensis]|uniref:Methyltransferase n=1 Tax=Paractinoplanes tereljensis TaxID=571912 RepID=A0A919TWW0_9ACTN|nr:methyltransferase domain-containing protein [Actinoplanes tereljensis]GIF23287.1 methyltransferase [Actinoplanes tereljensis]
MSPDATGVSDQIEYMDIAATTAVGRYYKQRFLSALDLMPGHTVIDVGCGPGTDLGRLADVVGPSGSVIGVDHDRRMLAEAGRRYANRPHIELRLGDMRRLPLPDACVDRARTDRVMQHVADPAAAIVQLRRVLRPGGVLGMAEPDWDTLTVADQDVEISRRFSRFVAERVRNTTIGRDVVRLAAAAGFKISAVQAIAVVFRDFATADQILGLQRNSARAVEAGALPERDTREWLERLPTAPFLAGFTFYLITAHI